MLKRPRAKPLSNPPSLPPSLLPSPLRLGPPYSEARLLALAALYEQAHPFHTLVPREPAHTTDEEGTIKTLTTTTAAAGVPAGAAGAAAAGAAAARPLPFYPGPRTSEEAAKLNGFALPLGGQGKDGRGGEGGAGGGVGRGGRSFL